MISIMEEEKNNTIGNILLYILKIKVFKMLLDKK
jgi:hypothetical protein